MRKEKTLGPFYTKRQRHCGINAVMTPSDIGHIENKKVLLRERKRHNDRTISSHRIHLLPEVGYPPSPQPGLTGGGGVPEFG